MGLFDRIARVFKANVNDMISKAEDPEKMLEQTLMEMQNDLIELRQAVAKSIAAQKKTEQQFEKNSSEAVTWQQRAQLALTKGDESLAKEALMRKKSFADNATALQQQLVQQKEQVKVLQNNLIALESKIAEAKTKKDMLKARISAAKATQQLQSTVSNMNTGSAMAAFERMEEKVLEMEAVTQAGYEIAGTGLNQQFAQLEASSAIDDELEIMKRQLTGGTTPQGALPQGTSSPNTSNTSSSPVDAELEELRRKIDGL